MKSDESFTLQSCLCDVGFTGPFCETIVECIHGSITSENNCACDLNWTGEDCSKCIEGMLYIKIIRRIIKT